MLNHGDKISCVIKGIRREGEICFYNGRIYFLHNADGADGGHPDPQYMNGYRHSWNISENGEAGIATFRAGQRATDIKVIKKFGRKAKIIYHHTP